MLKRKCFRKIIITTAILFSFFLMNLFPNKEYKETQTLEYVTNYHEEAVYLLDQYQRLARTSVVMDNEKDIEAKAKKMLKLLILEGESEAKLPSGFKGIIPSDTTIIGIQYADHLLKVNFSKELLNVSLEQEEKMVEAIVFTLLEIEDVEKVILYVDGEILTKLPKSKKNLPATLDRSFGINKEYSMESYKEVTPVTIYYISKYNDDYYYVPVTKYVNDSREKIKIIIEQLSSSAVNSTNLMSFLNSNTKLLATQEEVDSLFLVFNEYIFNDMDTKNILEEVIYSISLSVRDNYDVKEVIFKTGDEEIYKSVLKTIE
jgi:germination protein M